MLRLSRIGYVPTAEELQRSHDYCRRDVEIGASSSQPPPLSADGKKLWELDAVNNARGFHVDLLAGDGRSCKPRRKRSTPRSPSSPGGKSPASSLAKITASARLGWATYRPNQSRSMLC